MYKLTAANYTSMPVTGVHKNRIREELRSLGVSNYGLLKQATRHLPYIVHPDEHVEAIVYGRNDKGPCLLAATDRRVIFLDKKPLFVKSDELAYDIVGGVTTSQSGFVKLVSLHTRMGDFKLRTMNFKCAAHFRDFIEARCLGNPSNNFVETYDTNYK